MEEKNETSTNPKDAVGRSKPPLHLIPPAAEILESVVFGLGAKKYGPFNWRKYTVAASVYVSALKRHLAAWWDGQDDDPESGVSHLAHARACLAILIDAQQNNTLVDDRPDPGSAARLIAENTKSPVDLDACGTVDGVTPIPSPIEYVGDWNFADMPGSPGCWLVTPDGKVWYVDPGGIAKPGVFSLDQIADRVSAGILVANKWQPPTPVELPRDTFESMRRSPSMALEGTLPSSIGLGSEGMDGTMKVA